MVGGCGQEKERRRGGGLPGSCAAPVFVEEGTVGGKRRSSGEKQKGRLFREHLKPHSKLICQCIKVHASTVQDKSGKNPKGNNNHAFSAF